MADFDPAPLPGVALVVYVAALFALGLWARGRIHNTTDYLVAGRSLSLPLASATLFATWFGAGTLLAVTDEVRAEGVRAAALDPIGAGACLLLAGVFLARRLWRLQLLTVVDFFRRRFGARAELLAGVLMVPGFCGWVAAQFVALAAVLELIFGLDPALGRVLVAIVGAGYTLLGGMWSVTITDAFQVVLLLVGLVILGFAALAKLGAADPVAGFGRLLAETPPDLLTLVPLDELRPLLAWLGLFAAAALGNLPGQDLAQRILAARSERVAQRACIVAGIAYLGFGLIPVGLGLAARLLAPESEQAILPLLADLLLSPALVALFTLALASAVLSTIDSAILAPSSVLAQNVLPRLPLGRIESLRLNQLCVIGVAAISLAIAQVGESAYGLLESAYEIGLVSLLVPLALGLYEQRRGERAALVSMVTGTSLWTLHRVLGWEWFAGPVLEPLGLTLPMGLSCAALALGAYLLVAPSPSSEQG